MSSMQCHATQFWNERMCSRVSRFLNMSGPSYSIALVSEQAKYCCWGARGFMYALPFPQSVATLVFQLAPLEGGGPFVVIICYYFMNYIKLAPTYTRTLKFELKSKEKF